MKTKEIDGYTLPDVDVKLTINDDANARVYEGISDKGSPFAIGFIGESKRKKFAYGFRDENQRAEYVEKWFSDLASNRKHQVEKKAKAQADSEEFAKTLSVGEILHCPWGYSMCLNDFYQIVGFTPSRKSVKVRKLNKYLNDHDGYGQIGHETCRKDDFATDNVRTLRIRDGYVRVSSHQIAYKWDGLPKYYNSMD